MAPASVREAHATLPLVVAVATSGGRDSTALLHCTLRQAAPLGVQVLALHVHHGLQPQADDWLTRVRAQSRRWGAGFDSRHLSGAPTAGESVEAWARRGRYAALVQMAQAADCGLVLLAHHRRDQAETVLLQALRGAGPAGLAAMPVQRRIDGVVFARPWLTLPREAIEVYLKRHRLRFVDDDSNADPRYTRNRLRLQLWPALLQAFPEAENTLQHTAQRCAEARALADECAQADLVAAAAAGGGLQLAVLRALSPARRCNALRAWLAVVQPLPVPETLVRRLADELLRSAHARWPGPGGQVWLRRGQVVWADGAALHRARRAAPVRRQPGA